MSSGARRHPPLSLRPSRRHALVLGGGVAGLLAARVLADHFRRVTLVERGTFPGAPEVRRGVPQSHHQHTMLARGRQILERLFPGIDAELGAAGAPLADYARDAILISSAGRLPRFPTRDIHIRCYSRPLLDWLLLRRLAAVDNLTILEGRRGAGLVADESRRRVTGARLEAPGAAPPEVLAADLVVDATGRGSPSPRWLAELGYQPPPEQVVNAFLGYASRIYRPPDGFDGDWLGVEMTPRPPDNPRAASMWAIEGDRWLLTLAGTARTYPPRDEAGFLEFARRLPSRLIYDLICRAEPLTPIHVHRRTENRWRRYERLRRLPEGFLAIGDAICAFNPLYGQGMTIAALEAALLDECLGGAADGDLAGLGPRFYRRALKPLEAAWMLATSEDYRWPQTEGGKPDRLTRWSFWYIERLWELSASSPRVVEAFLAVANMLKGPAAFAHPLILGKVLWSLLGVGARRSAG